MVARCNVGNLAVARMNEFSSLAPCVSGNGSVAGTYQAVQDTGEAFFCTGREVVINDVEHIGAGIKLESAIPLSVAL